MFYVFELALKISVFIYRKEDSNVLNSMMTEWEYLYCKLLFINNIVEGDEGLMINKRLMKMANKNTKISSIAKNIDNSSGSSTSSYFKLEQFRKRWINKHDFVEKEVFVDTSKIFSILLYLFVKYLKNESIPI